jgi:pimeloyl-ACP methyl ester carboxylesterase
METLRVSARLADGWRSHVDPSCLAGWQPERFALAHGETEVIAIGAGAPLLLLPPLPGWKEAWIGVAARLARSFRVITFDQRERFAGGDPWEEQLADLERVADAYAPGAAAVLGHSLGGALAQRWALRHPNRVAALVLSSSFARLESMPGHWRKRYVEQLTVLAGQRWLPEGIAAPLARSWARRGAWVYDSRCDERTLAFVRHAIRRVPVGLAAARVRQAMTHDTREALGALRCPTLVVTGELETAGAQSASDELCRLVPGAMRLVSPGVGHLHPISGAEWLADQVATWLSPCLRLGTAGVTVSPCAAE